MIDIGIPDALAAIKATLLEGFHQQLDRFLPSLEAQLVDLCAKRKPEDSLSGLVNSLKREASFIMEDNVRPLFTHISRSLRLLAGVRGSPRSSSQSLKSSEAFTFDQRLNTGFIGPQSPSGRSSKPLSASSHLRDVDLAKEEPASSFFSSKNPKQEEPASNPFQSKFIMQAKLESEKMNQDANLFFELSDIELSDQADLPCPFINDTTVFNGRLADESLHLKDREAPVQYYRAASSPEACESGLRVIDVFSKEAGDLFLAMRAFLDSLVPKNAHCVSVQLINNQRSPEWFTQRGIRLTASRFGAIFKRKAFDPPELLHKLVHGLLNPIKYGKIPAMEYGTNNEAAARDEYQQKTGNHVEETGFWVRTDCAWLGGSPDGIVTDSKTQQKGLLEIKCLYSARHMTIAEYVDGKKGAYLRRFNDMILLDKGHDYFFQMQGCMFLLDLPWCDFVVRTEKDMFVERIPRNNEFIGSMVKRLNEFYCRFMLPSLCTKSHKSKAPSYIAIDLQAFHKQFISLTEIK